MVHARVVAIAASELGVLQRLVPTAAPVDSDEQKPSHGVLRMSRTTRAKLQKPGSKRMRVLTSDHCGVRCLLPPRVMCSNPDADLMLMLSSG